MKRTLVELILLFIISSLIVFFQFNEVPKKLSWDEVEFARLALSLENKPYLPYSQQATGHSTFYFYILLASIKIFGLTNFALRFPSALFGVINILVFYLICKDVFAKIKYFENPSFKFPFIAFLSSIVLITSRWYFNFARFSFEVTFLLFLELTAIYFLFKYADKQSSKHIILTALFSGLAFLSYYPGRIFFLLPLMFLILNQNKISVKKDIITFSGIFLITVSPLLIYLSTHQDLRIREQLFLTDKKLSVAQKISYFTLNTTKLAYMFTHYGDLNGRHNYPGKATFNPIVGAFFLLGLLVTLLNLKNIYNLFFISYFFLSLLPAFFTYPMENPNSLRTYTAIVPAVFFIGNGLLYLLQSGKKSIRLVLMTVFLLTALFTLSSLYDLRTYFRYQRIVFDKAFELNGTIKRIINLKLWEKTGEL